MIDWLKEASISAVSRLMGLSWNAVDGIMQRTVKRGFARRQEQTVAQIGVDETSFRRRHNYATIAKGHPIGHGPVCGRRSQDKYTYGLV